tara:strand:+ start:31 stop:252 length:222 start_codon:yes stop_codon:yes gene_type:complete
MATVTNWIDHLSAAEVQGPVYPGVGTEGILVLVLVILWLGWHVVSNMQEKSKMDTIARKRPGSNDWKSNITDG